ncbi:sigma-70 family RNA polymerase sigma factor [Robiginitalea sp. M366]|uniref:RNA polymerase sigma factor n=1 Tax=Robiginitalea aestuariiviva TaxID=3036903 RepID=UPI00240E3774|nr:sigma-70 family RNA polymerase sigma factor [Robiginitalea aestuariiviva]MDG1570883.1 sigma-70 family RNA polymerase sigma factor [Robiginitalea aestuariiviva]
MKIISLFRNERTLVEKARAGQREAQKALYESLAPTMLAVCRRYIPDLHFAEDVMISGFVKVFQGLDSYRFEGSFEGWVRRIMVRQAIDFLRKKQFVEFEETPPEPPVQGWESADFLELQEIEKMIDALPEGYRTVFVLYAVEGYTHPEIADMLNISESTSKSQLFKARKRLQDHLEAQQKTHYGTR